LKAKLAVVLEEKRSSKGGKGKTAMAPVIVKGCWVEEKPV